MRFVLGLDDDHSEFLRRFADDPLLGERDPAPARAAAAADGDRRARAPARASPGS